MKNIKKTLSRIELIELKSFTILVHLFNTMVMALCCMFNFSIKLIELNWVYLECCGCCCICYFFKLRHTSSDNDYNRSSVLLEYMKCISSQMNVSLKKRSHGWFKRHRQVRITTILMWDYNHTVPMIKQIMKLISMTPTWPT